MSKDTLITKYRPQSFKQVVGQDATVNSFRKALESGNSHSFLFSGPGGTGKTTLARLGAKFLGAKGNTIVEVDAATYSGVDEVRTLTANIGFKPIGNMGPKCFIIDECHRFSKSAWDALLKPLEEPPAHVYWFLCTTALAAVPTTIQTRCTKYNLNAVSRNDLVDLLIGVCEAEGFATPDKVLRLCAERANGSPRQALAYLSAVVDAETSSQAAEIIDKQDDESEVTGFELAKALLAGNSWAKIQPILAQIKKDAVHPESVRHVVREYFTTVAINAKTEQDARAVMPVLEEFYEPFNQQDGYTPLVLAIARIILANRS